jgi:hypothetical protein
MHQTLTTGYAGMVDSSTPATLSATLANAADAARQDAAAKQAQADELRREAAGMEDKPGLTESAERLLEEAANAEDDAEQRLCMAAAFDERAANEANVA